LQKLRDSTRSRNTLKDSTCIGEKYKDI